MFILILRCGRKNYTTTTNGTTHLFNRGFPSLYWVETGAAFVPFEDQTVAGRHQFVACGYGTW